MIIRREVKYNKSELLNKGNENTSNIEEKSFLEEINNLDNRMNLKVDDYQYESNFQKKYNVDKLKSYIEMLKEFNLGHHMFYDEPGLNMKEFQDDVCECRTNSDIYNCKKN
jgi:hypothetical protein